MCNLDELRKEIDIIDAKLLDLLNARMDICKAIGQYKKENNMPILNNNREQEVINKLKSRENYDGMVESIWHPIMDYAKTIE